MTNDVNEWHDGEWVGYCDICSEVAVFGDMENEVAYCAPHAPEELARKCIAQGERDGWI